ncbi:MAG: hypothetical protein AAGF92_07655 [Myxococcota bacterium]
MASVFFGGCGDSGSDNGTGGTGGTSEDQFLVVTRVRTPDSRANFASVVPTLDVDAIDLSNALEFSGLSRVRTFDGKVFSFDGESGVVTRFVVEGTRLAEDVLDDGSRARFSMASVGVTGFTNQIAFISEQRAYYVDLANFQVVVWNPTDMDITSTFPAPELRREDFGAAGGGVSILDDFVFMPISWGNESQATFVPVAALAVFSASEDAVFGVIEDDRCVSSSAAFADNGAVYVVADAGGGFAEILTEPGTVPPPCLLEWIPGEATFNPGFYRDLAEIAGVPIVRSGLGRGDGTFVLQLYTSDVDPRTLLPIELVDGNFWQWAAIDFRQDTSTLIEAIAPGGVSSVGWVVDDMYFVPEFNDDAGASTLFEIESPDATEFFTATGEIFIVARIQ